MNSDRIHTDMRSMEANIIKPLFAEIKENNCLAYYKLIQCVVWDLRGGDCGSLWPSSINWVHRFRITTVFCIKYNINYIDSLYTTYIFRIM